MLCAQPISPVLITETTAPAALVGIGNSTERIVWEGGVGGGREGGREGGRCRGRERGREGGGEVQKGEGGGK